MKYPQKVAKEWELCPKCKHDNSSKCIQCTEFYGSGPAMIMCGIPVGVAPLHYHTHFEARDESLNTTDTQNPTTN